MVNYDKLKKVFKGKFNYWGIHNYGFDEAKDQIILKDLMAPDVELFSVIVLGCKTENLTNEAYSNPKAFNFKKEWHESPLNQAVNKEFHKDDRENCKTIWKQVKKRFNVNEQDQGSFVKFDLILAEWKRKKKKELTPSILIEETSNYLYDHPDARFQQFSEDLSCISDYDNDNFLKLMNSFLEKNPELKTELIKKISKKTQVTYRQRTFKRQLPPHLSKMLADWTMWQQVYVIRHGKDIYVQNARSEGSSTRENQGICGHLFAALQNLGKSIQTFTIDFDANFDLAKINIHDELVLVDRDLTGNYQIESKKSAKLLKDITKIDGYSQL